MSATIEDTLTRATARLDKLIDPSLLKLSRAVSQTDLNSQSKIDLILELYSKVELLRNKNYRQILTDALREDQAKSLCIELNLNSENPWISLRKVRIIKQSSKEEKLFLWFGLSSEEIKESITPALILEETSEQISSNHGLYSHQRNAVRSIESFLNSDMPRAFLHMPTGSGKTRTAMNYVCNYLNRNEPTIVLWLAFNSELCDQAASEFKLAWPQHGNREVKIQRLWGKHDREKVNNDTIIIAGLDKLRSTMDFDNSWLPRIANSINLIVFDEAHQSTAETYQDIINVVLDLNENCKLLGLSATPGRTYNDPVEDAKLSDLYFRQKVTLEVKGHNSPLEYLIDEKYLSKPDFKQLSFESKFAKFSDYIQNPESNDYNNKFLKKLSEDEFRNILILEKIDELISKFGHRKIIVFCIDVHHSNTLSTFMKMNWEYRCASITSETPPYLRSHWIKKFVDPEDKEPFILFNYGVLTTGFDAPMTSAAIIARPTKSLVLYSQMVGRAIRGPKVGGTLDAEIWTVIDQNLPGFRDISEAFLNWEDVW